MSTGIVYEGVTPQGGGGGTLFKGKKFWVAQRVPMRAACLRNIESNGGEVVRIEKNADYLIADHARQDAPPGSYSFNFISDCIATGTFKQIEDYARPEASRKTRPVGSSAPQRGFRTAFTPEDDALLSKWVTWCEKKGYHILGNTIYEQLEQKNSRHTWQSWKNRWIEKLQNLPRPPVADNDFSPFVQSEFQSTAVIGASPSRPASSRNSTRNPFTPEDDTILLEHIRQCQADDKRTSGNKIFEDLAKDFPQHTMHSWRDRWLRTLSKRFGGNGHRNTPRKAASSRASSAPQTPKENRQLKHREAILVEDPRDGSASQGVTEKQGEIEDEDGKGIQEQQPPKPPHPPLEVSPVRSQEPQEEFGNGSRPQSPNPSHEAPINRQVETLSHTAGEHDLKQEFYQDYQAYADSKESQVRWWPTILGKSFELWALWQAVQAQKVEPGERDWQQISEVLGFNWVQDESAPEEVRHCYEAHLGEFETALMDFDEQSGEEDTQQIAIPGTPMPSSPPVLPSLKRSYATALGHSPTYPQSSPKRARHKLDEVPSTPEEKTGTSHLRRQRLENGRSPNLEAHNHRPDTNLREIDRQSQGDEQVESQGHITPSQQLRSELEARSEPNAATTPTPIRTARTPFLPDDSDDPDETSPKPSTAIRPSAPLPSSSLPQPKRRSLPPSLQSEAPTAKQSPALRPQPKPQVPVQELPQDVVDFYVSLGYAPDAVVRALDATTWVPGLASQLMEILKRGEALPANWRGVWTKKDDEALRLVREGDPPQGAKEQRKREKQREKLEKKHTPEAMEMRARFLEKGSSWRAK